MFPKHLWRKNSGKIKNVDPLVHGINPFPPDDVKALSNPHNNTRSSVYFHKTNSPMSSFEDQDFVSYKK